jgi:hypothetical protein
MTLPISQTKDACLTLDGVQHALAEIGEAERHFNQLGSQYRILASTWLLAAFGAIGYVLTAEHLAVSAASIVLLVSLAGSVGILLLWTLDLLVYHRLLDANFLEGLKLELEFPAVPQIRWAMWQQFSAGLGVTTLLRIYYCGCSLAPMAAGAYLLAASASPSTILLAAQGGGAIVVLMAATFLWQRSKNDWLIARVRDLQRNDVRPV